MDEYGVPDLRQLMASRTQFCTTSQFQEPFSAHGNLTAQPYYQPMLVPAGGLVDHLHPPHYSTIINGCAAAHPPNNNAAATTSSAAALYGIDLEHGHGWNNNINVGMNAADGGNNMNCRWPRQETLTLLEIRSGLDSKFKETNQKGPLWDEVSRIMGEEHGYQRSGKKCKEKFENLYKYYKKTKEGKAGRQDGKHYRFFRQLEAIYGDQTSNQSSTYGRLNPFFIITLLQMTLLTLKIKKWCKTKSTSVVRALTSSSENNDDDLSISAIDYFMMNQSMGSLKNEKQSCARPIGKVINTQEAWMEKMLKSIEHREEERIAQEEEWRKQQAAKFDREVQRIWAKERAWVESRDAAIMEALGTFSRPGISNHDKDKDDISKLQIPNDTINRWTEHEVASLIRLIRTSLVLTIQDGGCFKEGLWEEIAAKMGCLGYRRSVGECKEKWENMGVFPRMTPECNKKHKQDAKANMYHGQLSCYEGQQEVLKRRPDGMGLQLMDGGLSPSSSNMDVSSNSFHVQFNGGENLWDRYGTVKLSKGKNQ
ncbi:trihelix transcription factor PTL-like [Prunus yedoensis var. nudiflora]|uniref:Trihelix transcription factor PTL-like n=1 Tax=Prunus yedoensis var. nudiflora TaxID=2094558 RepID=A0A314UQB5_PRUYE|nr:trihelix transcription factor PTL-like [Prunus yedoensis var. nudiflora]